MTARDFSVMPVQLVDEPKPLERAVRRHGKSLNVGSICDVEFGATWATRGGRQYRVDGQWFACRVLRHEGAIVHVELLPDVRLTCRCDHGWVCEDHPEQPLNHDDCDGAGRRCDNARCPWWRGPKPAALDLSSERGKPS